MNPIVDFMLSPSFESHAYDIEISKIDRKISNAIHEPKIKRSKKIDDKLYLRSITHLIKTFCKEEAISYDVNRTEQYIVSSSSRHYLSFLSFTLAHFEVPKIKSLLNYQKSIFQGNEEVSKNNFVELIEHQCYDQTKAHSFYETKDRLKEIMEWVREQTHKPVAKNDDKVSWITSLLILKAISEDLREQGFTRSKLAFYKAFTEKKICGWKREANFLIVLIEELVEREPLILINPETKHKANYTDIQILFCDESGKVARPISFKHRKSRLTKKTVEHSKIKGSVVTLLSKCFAARDLS